MDIALVHPHYDQTHLDKIKAEMATMGAPSIHAVWLECHSTWVALEGCHRLRAARELGLTPEIIEVEYSDTATLSEVIPGWADDEDYTIADICEYVNRTTILSF